MLMGDLRGLGLRGHAAANITGVHTDSCTTTLKNEKQVTAPSRTKPEPAHRR